MNQQDITPKMKLKDGTARVPMAPKLLDAAATLHS